tara:strand:- start:1424 stop:1666 length:243 start_codon:yes stop_codon:yes gene_type:complete
MDQETNVIPPKFTGCYETTDYFKKYGNTFSGLLRNLKIGDYVKVTHKESKNCYATANQIGIKIATRRMGSKTHTRIYRVE